MAFETACPECGNHDLRIVRCMVYGSFKLEEDGFVVDGPLDTEDELAECATCGQQFKLNKLEGDARPVPNKKGVRHGK